MPSSVTTPSSSPRTHLVEGENQLLQLPLMYRQREGWRETQREERDKEKKGERERVNKMQFKTNSRTCQIKWTKRQMCDTSAIPELGK